MAKKKQLRSEDRRLPAEARIMIGIYVILFGLAIAEVLMEIFGIV